MKTKLIFVCLVALMLLPGLIQAQQPTVVTIRLSQVQVADPIVSIGDIANVRSYRADITKTIEALDLHVFDESSTEYEISSRQVRMRLRLAGYSPQDVLVQGATRTRVDLVKPVVSERSGIERLVETELSSQFGIPTTDISVTLLGSASLDRLPPVSSIETGTVIFPGSLPLGEVSLPIEVKDWRGQRIRVELPFRIVVMREVLVTRQRIPKGSVITAEYLQAIKRPLVDGSIEVADQETCLGCVAKTDIPRYQLLTTSSLSEPVRSRGKLVRRGDIVDALINKGPVSIRLKNAKVLSSAALGEVVKIANPETNKQLVGVLRDRTTVVIGGDR